MRYLLLLLLLLGSRLPAQEEPLTSQLLRRASSELAEGDYAAALTSWNSLLERQLTKETRSNVLYNRGLTLYFLQRYQEAYEQLSQVANAESNRVLLRDAAFQNAALSALGLADAQCTPGSTEGITECQAALASLRRGIALADQGADFQRQFNTAARSRSELQETRAALRQRLIQLELWLEQQRRRQRDTSQALETVLRGIERVIQALASEGSKPQVLGIRAENQRQEWDDLAQKLSLDAQDDLEEARDAFEKALQSLRTGDPVSASEQLDATRWSLFILAQALQNSDLGEFLLEQRLRLARLPNSDAALTTIHAAFVKWASQQEESAPLTRAVLDRLIKELPELDRAEAHLALYLMKEEDPTQVLLTLLAEAEAQRVESARLKAAGTLFDILAVRSEESQVSNRAAAVSGHLQTAVNAEDVIGELRSAMQKWEPLQYIAYELRRLDGLYTTLIDGQPDTENVLRPLMERQEALQRFIDELGSEQSPASLEEASAESYTRTVRAFSSRRAGRPLHGQGHLRSGRQWVRRALRSLAPAATDPADVLSWALQEQEYARDLNSLLQRLESEVALERDLYDDVLQGQSKALDAAAPFDKVVRESLNGEAIESIQASEPWNEVLPLFYQGLDEAGAAERQLRSQQPDLAAASINQEAAYQHWKEALEKLQKESPDQAQDNSQDQQDPAEDQNEQSRQSPPQQDGEERSSQSDQPQEPEQEQQGSTAPQELLELLRSMDEEDELDEGQKLPAREGLRPW